MNKAKDDGQLLIEHRSELHETVFYIHRLANFRAQTELAVRLVRAAVRRRVFKKRSNLLIIGGGISGVAAGLEAAKHGMIVTLFESKRTLLSVQRPCRSRYMHPYEYEWPLAHYTARTFPFTGRDKKYCPEPMRWTADIASRVAKRMAAQIHAEVPSTLTLKPGARHIPVSEETLLKDFDPRGAYQFILVCAGARERTGIPKFEFASFPYWASDPLENLCSRHEPGRRPQRILLSGGGDGGLQDLLRIVTQPLKKKLFAAGQLLKKLLPALERSPEFVEWRKSKQGNWDAYRPDRKTMWKEFKALLNSMEANTRCWNSLSLALRKSIHPAVMNGEVRAQLAFRGAHFSEAFALNAFLVHLLNRIVKEHRWLLPKREVNSVKSATKSHRCTGDPEKCFGQLHSVYWKSSRAHSRKAEVFDVVVLRHGSDQVFATAPKKKLKKSRPG